MTQIQSGDYPAAIIAANEARRADPSSPEAHYVYGQACAALSEHLEAERAFAEAVRLKPGWADAWVNYGLACYARGDVEVAKTAMRCALNAQPGHPVATGNLGALLRITGHHETSEHLLRAALSRDPNNAGVRLNLVAELLQDEQPRAALTLLDDVSPPKNPQAARHWHLQRAMALVGLGRPSEAREALAPLEAPGHLPPEVLPLWHWRLVLIALAEGRITDAKAEAHAMEAALAHAGAAALLEHRIMAHYDLAKFWSGLDAPRQAFAHWVTGHDLLRTVQPFSREATASFDAATVAVFTARRFASGPRARNDDDAPVFIVGMPRSGTTLCQQVVAAHARAHGAGERSALGHLFHRLAGGLTAEGVARIAALPQEALDAAAASYLAELRALAPNKTRIVDKMPGNYRFVWLIALLFPEARIIHCTRDPRDTGLSIFTFRFHGEHGYAHDLRDLGWSIAQQDRLMTHWKAVLPNPILTVRLDDWVQAFDATLARVLAHLDLPPDPNCARFYEAENRVRTVSRAQVRQPINARGLGRWKAYAAELAPLIRELERPGSLVSGVTTTVASASPTRDDKGSFRLSRPDDADRALGMAVNYLMMKPAFAALRFGSGSQVLAGQIDRGHFAFCVDSTGRVRGFVGWALTTRDKAEAWADDRAELGFADSFTGDCVVFDGWATDHDDVRRFLIDEVRRFIEHKSMLYWKRRYPDGRTRAVRLPVSTAVSRHVRRQRRSWPSGAAEALPV